MQIQIDRSPFNAVSRLPAPYFTLLVRPRGESEWTIEFGDYDREAVEYDADIYEYDGDDTMILKTEDARQVTIENAAAAYRAKSGAAK